MRRGEEDCFLNMFCFLKTLLFSCGFTLLWDLALAIIKPEKIFPYPSNCKVVYHLTFLFSTTFPSSNVGMEIE